MIGADFYIIHREGTEKDLGEVTLTAIGNGIWENISPARSLKLVNHSPTGFEFGYAGSGPSQLALAILLDFTNDKMIAQARYQDFKSLAICCMKHPGGIITAKQIQRFLNVERPAKEHEHDG